MLEEPVRTTEAFVLGRLAVTPAWQTATTLQHMSGSGRVSGESYLLADPVL